MTLIQKWVMLSLVVLLVYVAFALNNKLDPDEIGIARPLEERAFYEWKSESRSIDNYNDPDEVFDAFDRFGNEFRVRMSINDAATPWKHAIVERSNPNYCRVEYDEGWDLVTRRWVNGRFRYQTKPGEPWIDLPRDGKDYPGTLSDYFEPQASRFGQDER